MNAVPIPATQAPDTQSPMSLDPKRLENALSLTVQRLRGEGRFLVSGGAKPHKVNFYVLGPQRRCDCEDAYYRPEHVCKHQLACLLHVGNPDVLRALGEVVKELRAEAELAAREAKRFQRYRSGKIKKPTLVAT